MDKFNKDFLDEQLASGKPAEVIKTLLANKDSKLIEKKELTDDIISLSNQW